MADEQESMEAARERFWAYLRRIRNARLAGLDKPLEQAKLRPVHHEGRAIEIAALEKAKQHLRQIPQDIKAAVDAAQTPEELEALFPLELR